jgi:hypothetical protein
VHSAGFRFAIASPSYLDSIIGKLRFGCGWSRHRQHSEPVYHGGQDTSCNSNGQTLDPAGSCILGIEFNPAESGTIGGSVVLTDNALNSVAATQTIRLLGTGIGPATITSPVSGGTLSGASTTINWNSNGSTTPVYLWIGSTAGAYDLVNIGPLSGSSTTVTLPTSGAPVYATLWSTVNSNLVSSAAGYNGATPDLRKGAKPAGVTKKRR